MAALWNRAGHYIFALWFLLSSFFFFLSFFFSRNTLFPAKRNARDASTLRCVKLHASTLRATRTLHALPLVGKNL